MSRCWEWFVTSLDKLFVTQVHPHSNTGPAIHNGFKKKSLSGEESRLFGKHWAVCVCFIALFSSNCQRDLELSCKHLLEVFALHCKLLHLQSYGRSRGLQTAQQWLESPAWYTCHIHPWLRSLLLGTLLLRPLCLDFSCSGCLKVASPLLKLSCWTPEKSYKIPRLSVNNRLLSLHMLSHHRDIFEALSDTGKCASCLKKYGADICHQSEQIWRVLFKCTS